MIAAKPIGSVHGLDLFQKPDCTVTAWRGPMFVGAAFPAVTTQPDGPWFGRRQGQSARRFDTEHSALAYVVRGCPECVCVPFLCRTDDTGEHCADMSCGPCLHGCPEGECDMTEENR